MAQAQSNPNWMCEALLRVTGQNCDLVRGNSAGASYPQIFDAFNINPGSIPTALTPVGLEAYVNKSDFNITGIKGQGKVGGALYTSQTQANYFSNVNNLEVALRNARATSSGTSVASSSSLSSGAYSPAVGGGIAVPLAPPKFFLAPVLGASLKRSSENGNIKGSLGVSINTAIVHLGYSQSWESSLEKVTSGNIGIRVFKFMVDYTYLKNVRSTYSSTTDHTKILSVTGSLFGLELNYGYRYQYSNGVTSADIDRLRELGVDYKRSHNLFGVQYRWGEKFSLGVFNNYVLRRRPLTGGPLHFLIVFPT